MIDRASQVPRRWRGFSLVELIVVVAVIAVMSVIAIPLISRYLRTYRIRGAAQEVAGEITRARGKAIASNTNRGVLFIPGIPDANGQPTLYQFWVEDDPALPGTIPPLPVLPQNGPPNGLVGRLPTGVVFAPPAGGGGAGVWGGRAIRFDRLGRVCNPAGANCPDATGAAPNGIFVNAAASPVVTVLEVGTGLAIRVEVAPGGRVVTKDWTQP